VLVSSTDGEMAVCCGLVLETWLIELVRDILEILDDHHNV